MSRTALIVVDVQNDFCEGGALAVEGGAKVASDLNYYITLNANKYDYIVATLDYHAPPPHDNCGHFALDDEPDFTKSWPVHCVAKTTGADIHPNLKFFMFDGLFYKGYGTQSYSGFEGVDEGSTSLLASLRSLEITDIDIAGLAYDYCVKATAIDALRLGFNVQVLRKYTAGVSETTSNEASNDMICTGVKIVD